MVYKCLRKIHNQPSKLEKMKHKAENLNTIKNEILNLDADDTDKDKISLAQKKTNSLHYNLKIVLTGLLIVFMILFMGLNPTH